MVVGTMPITHVAEKLEEIPEPLRPNAKEENGKFAFVAPDGWGLDNVAQSRSKMTKLEQDLKRRDDRLKGFAIDDKGTLPEPEQFQQLLAEHKQLKEAQGKQPNVDELRKQIVAEAEGRYSKQLQDAQKLATEYDRELDNTKLDSTINELVAQMRPRDGKSELVRLLLREQLGLDKEDGKRVVRVKDPAKAGEWLTGGNGPDGYLPAKDYALNNLRTKYADLFEGDGVSGAGASSTGSTVRRGDYTFKRSELNGKADEYQALKKRADSEGRRVVFVD